MPAPTSGFHSVLGIDLRERSALAAAYNFTKRKVEVVFASAEKLDNLRPIVAGAAQAMGRPTIDGAVIALPTHLLEKYRNDADGRRAFANDCVHHSGLNVKAVCDRMFAALIHLRGQETGEPGGPAPTTWRPGPEVVILVELVRDTGAQLNVAVVRIVDTSTAELLAQGSVRGDASRIDSTVARLAIYRCLDEAAWKSERRSADLRSAGQFVLFGPASEVAEVAKIVPAGRAVQTETEEVVALGAARLAGRRNLDVSFLDFRSGAGCDSCVVHDLEEAPFPEACSPRRGFQALRDDPKPATPAPQDARSSDGRDAQEEGKRLHEVQFTVYRPRAVRPMKQYTLLVFTHLAERRPEAPPDEPDPIEEVRRQAQEYLGARVQQYRDTTVDARRAIPQEGEITLVPEVAGVEFDPPRRTFRWLHDVQREEFRLRAVTTANGPARGRLSVYFGVLLIAEMDLTVKVDSQCTTDDEQSPDRTRGTLYRKIFASYSHKDTEIVRQYERYVEALGDRYYRDIRDLRAGEDWDDGLLQLIEQADVFQLFWSSNSMVSPHVRREWEHALSLRRSSFVRPTYWEEPLRNCPIRVCRRTCSGGCIFIASHFRTRRPHLLPVPILLPMSAIRAGHTSLPKSNRTSDGQRPALKCPGACHRRRRTG